MARYHTHTVDPNVGINATWPDGSYMLVQPSAGCRPGWPAGYYRHDTEDDDNDNDATRGLLNYLRIPYDQDFVTVNYCAKSAGNTNTPWPVGKYCLAKHGHCPGGFLEGSITWDDEDTNNKNKILKPVPSSSNFRNPTFRYCCRQDGSCLLYTSDAADE